MRGPVTEAAALAGGDREAAAQLASKLLITLKNNFVERPWGGVRIREFKDLCPLPDQVSVTGLGLGEAFEISAFDDDAEAREYPSRLRLGDGSAISLPVLLEANGETILGVDFKARMGPGFPLLPKILDVKELLSVQGHPEGNTEVYIVIDAEPGATIRLGFKSDVNRDKLLSSLDEGRRRQEALLRALDPSLDPARLHEVLSPWLALKDVGAGILERDMGFWLGAASSWNGVTEMLMTLKEIYWQVLDLMNEIPIFAGQVIHNANPPRTLEGTQRLPSAEVHALGNPQGREILALEIRRPGPTFRAWDNVRFPIRETDATAAMDALSLKGTRPEDFLVEPRPEPGRPGVMCSVDSDAFRIQHLRPTADLAVQVPEEPPHCLHALRGAVAVHNVKGVLIGELRRGESALVPVSVGSYRVTAAGPDPEIIKANFPP